MKETLTDGEIYSLASFGGDKEAREQFIKEMREAVTEMDLNLSDRARFTANKTNYLANLSKHDIHEETFAVLYQHPPRDTEEYGRVYSMRFPFLIVSNYFGDEEFLANKVARILDKYWDDEEFADAR